MAEVKPHIDETEPLRPFLKWPGNKFRLVERIKRRLPEGRRLIEPFAGSGALFLNTSYKKYLLTDSNADLIELFNIIKHEGEAFIDAARHYFTCENNHAERYYELRDRFNKCRDPHQRAALFIYLNRHGYNGLCRYNKKGGYNVPFGRYKRPYFPEQELLKFSIKARDADFRVQSFEKTLKQARPGDVVYCDPPYVPLSKSSNFTSYSTGSFDLDQQRKLAELAQQTADRGVPVLISNHKTPFTREIYKSSKQEHFKVRRYISCNGNKRGMAGEMLALFT